MPSTPNAALLCCHLPGVQPPTGTYYWRMGLGVATNLDVFVDDLTLVRFSYVDPIVSPEGLALLMVVWQSMFAEAAGRAPCAVAFRYCSMPDRAACVHVYLAS